MSIKGRPEFVRMMSDVQSQKDDVEFVLVFKLSRFGRNAADILKSLQILDDFGANLVSVSESIDSSTPGGRLAIEILSAVAEMEHENITVQLTSGRLQKISKGGWTGGPIPYGYRNSENGLVQDEQEASIVRRIQSFPLLLKLNARTFWFRQWKDESRKPEKVSGMVVWLLLAIVCIKIREFLLSTLVNLK